ncbi:uncharacterized protein LOC123922779 [Trifolium pratense]|uniref:uncharacterized protein LOC123922779 n=1 Tax=Trifolium pratense TaxID=57577 RepID=UPI001E69494E|nr:uncharacterized protein LOC123922779 [Trifolium pratense]
MNFLPFSSPSDITQNIGEISSQQPTNHNAHNFQRNNINQGNVIFAPQAIRGAFYLRSLLNYHEQNTFNFGVNQLNGLHEWVPQINMNQQEYNHSTRIVNLPYASLDRSSISENQYSSSSTTNAIQVGENDEQQRSHIISTRDSELMRPMMQIELQRRHIRTKKWLTEDEIIKCISCGNFEATVEGTSKNKELCCICQEEYLTGEEIGKLDCAHIFHMNCIKQ